MRILFLALTLVLVMTSACDNDPDGDLLFQVTYDPVSFVIPAGQTNFRTQVVAQSRLPTRFTQAIRDNDASVDEIDLVGGFRARIVSTDGQDFSDLERAEIRICPVGQGNGCTPFDILFSVDDLFRRRDRSINLNPGLRNFRELFVGNEVVRFELVLFFGQTTTTTIEARLDWSVAAFGNL